MKLGVIIIIVDVFLRSSDAMLNEYPRHLKAFRVDQIKRVLRLIFPKFRHTSINPYVGDMYNLKMIYTPII